MYSFVVTEYHKKSSTYGAAQFFVSMDQKNMIDTYMKYYKIDDTDYLFSNYKNPSDLSK